MLPCEAFAVTNSPRSFHHVCSRQPGSRDSGCSHVPSLSLRSIALERGAPGAQQFFPASPCAWRPSGRRDRRWTLLIFIFSPFFFFAFPRDWDRNIFFPICKSKMLYGGSSFAPSSLREVGKALPRCEGSVGCIRSPRLVLCLCLLPGAGIFHANSLSLYSNSSILENNFSQEMLQTHQVNWESLTCFHYSFLPRKLIFF